MRALVVLCLCGFLVCCQSIENKNPVDIYISNAQEALQSVFKVNTPEGSGSCFHVGGGIYATNAHVILSAQGLPLEVSIEGEPVKVVSFSIAEDLALLYAPHLADVKAFQFSFAKPKLLEKVYSIGYHFGYQKGISPGNVTFIYDDYFCHNAALNPGCSGGVTLNAEYKIIGVNVAILAANPYAAGFNGVAYSIDKQKLINMIMGLSNE